MKGGRERKTEERKTGRKRRGRLGRREKFVKVQIYLFHMWKGRRFFYDPDDNEKREDRRKLFVRCGETADRYGTGMGRVRCGEGSVVWGGEEMIRGLAESGAMRGTLCGGLRGW